LKIFTRREEFNIFYVAIEQLPFSFKSSTCQFGLSLHPY
jgi:hypothetical protein